MPNDTHVPSGRSSGEPHGRYSERPIRQPQPGAPRPETLGVSARMSPVERARRQQRLAKVRPPVIAEARDRDDDDGGDDDDGKS